MLEPSTHLVHHIGQDQTSMELHTAVPPHCQSTHLIGPDMSNGTDACGTCDHSHKECYTVTTVTIEMADTAHDTVMQHTHTNN